MDSKELWALTLLKMMELTSDDMESARFKDVGIAEWIDACVFVADKTHDIYTGRFED